MFCSANFHAMQDALFKCVVWFTNGVMIANGSSLVTQMIARQIERIELVRLVANSRPFDYTKHIRVTTISGDWGIFSSESIQPVEKNMLKEFFD